MSESESYEEVTVASNGVTVIKTFEADAFPVPAIAFRIKSERREPVTVTLVDDVPENVAVEDLGFHPEYGSEHWTIEDDEITFEREIDSEEQYTTVYGIRATGTDDVEQFLTEPNIADVDPPLEDEDGVVGGSGSDVVRDVISGDTDSVPGLDDEDDDIGTLDLADPNDEGEKAEGDDEEKEEAEAEEGEEADEEEEEKAEAGADAATNGVGDVESVAAALASEIRAGNVDDDDLEVLRDELELNGAGGGEAGGAMKARIENLQTNVSDLEAYIDALEEFLEENGTGLDVIEDVQNGLDDLETQLSDLESEVTDATDQVSELDDNMDTLESNLEGDLADLESDLKSLKADIKDLETDSDSIQDTIEDVESQVEEVADVEDDVADIEDEIEELKEWREQLSSVLGAADE